MRNNKYKLYYFIVTIILQCFLSSCWFDNKYSDLDKFDYSDSLLNTFFPNIDELDSNQVNDYIFVVSDTHLSVVYPNCLRTTCIFIDVNYGNTEYDKEINRLGNCFNYDYYMIAYKDKVLEHKNGFLLYDDSKTLFNYDVYVALYSCVLFCDIDGKSNVRSTEPRLIEQEYLYALVDKGNNNIKYVYLNYPLNGYNREYVKDDFLPINFEKNKSKESYDGYYYDLGEEDPNNNYWPEDGE